MRNLSQSERAPKTPLIELLRGLSDVGVEMQTSLEKVLVQGGAGASATLESCTRATRTTCRCGRTRWRQSARPTSGSTSSWARWGRRGWRWSGRGRLRSADDALCRVLRIPAGAGARLDGRRGHVVASRPSTPTAASASRSRGWWRWGCSRGAGARGEHVGDHQGELFTGASRRSRPARRSATKTSGSRRCAGRADGPTRAAGPERLGFVAGAGPFRKYEVRWLHATHTI